MLYVIFLACIWKVKAVLKSHLPFLKSIIGCPGPKCSLQKIWKILSSMKMKIKVSVGPTFRDSCC